MKKTIALLLAALMIFSVALAEEPSKTADDVAQVISVEIKDPNGNYGPVPEFVGLTIELLENQQQIDALAEIERFLKVTGKPVGEIFPEDIREAYKDKDVELNELSGLYVSGYDPFFGDVLVTMQFPTVYEATQEIFPAVAIIDEAGAVTWYNVGAPEVLEDGTLKVTLEASLLEKLNDAPGAIIAILNTK